MQVKYETKPWRPLIKQYTSLPSSVYFRKNESNPHIHLDPSNKWQGFLIADKNPFLPCWICGYIILFSHPDSSVSYMNEEFAAGVKVMSDISRTMSGPLPSNHSVVLGFLRPRLSAPLHWWPPATPAWLMSLSTSENHPVHQAAESHSSSILCCSWEAFNCLFVFRDTS